LSFHLAARLYTFCDGFKDKIYFDKILRDEIFTKPENPEIAQRLSDCNIVAKNYDCNLFLNFVCVQNSNDLLCPALRES
jgi:hypothetical protein